MRKSGTEVVVASLPPCDFCLKQGGINNPAHYDAKTAEGPWAYLCEVHFAFYGVGLGIGTGQRLTLAEPKSQEATYDEWMAQVDEHLRKMTGFPLSHLDFGDFASRDLYDAGETAEHAAREILENELGEME